MAASHHCSCIAQQDSICSNFVQEWTCMQYAEKWPAECAFFTLWRHDHWLKLAQLFSRGRRAPAYINLGPVQCRSLLESLAHTAGRKAVVSASSSWRPSWPTHPANGQHQRQQLYTTIFARVRKGLALAGRREHSERRLYSTVQLVSWFEIVYELSGLWSTRMAFLASWVLAKTYRGCISLWCVVCIGRASTQPSFCCCFKFCFVRLASYAFRVLLVQWVDLFGCYAEKFVIRVKFDSRWVCECNRGFAVPSFFELQLLANYCVANDDWHSSSVVP